MNDIFLTPRVKKHKVCPGFWDAPRPAALCIPAELEELREPLGQSWGDVFCFGSGGAVSFRHCGELSGESYRIRIEPEEAVIFWGKPAGAFYGLMTLRQLLLKEGPVPCMTAEDEPGLTLRGFMLDVSRGKVPSMETLRETVDLLAELKYNHLELYLEGFSFAYPSFFRFWRNQTPITPEELRGLDEYCRKRFIELAPNQNSLGHMASWLEQPEYAHLAEKEEGLVTFGIHTPPTTLDTGNPESLELVERMMDDLLPCFTSGLFHAGLDEPFELGKGKNRELAERSGTDALYLGYVQKLHEAVKRRGRSMLMWGDVAGRSPELTERLPEEAVLMEWGYEAEHPFEKRAAVLRKLGRRFCVCPGTCTWNSFCGITDNMLINVRRAARAAGDFGAEGILLTDWGDMGHLQYWPASWPAIVLNSALAWGGGNTAEADLTEEELAEALDRFVFQDGAGVMGRAVMDSGRYSRYEEWKLGCRTMASLPLMFGPLRGRAFERGLQAVISMTAGMVPPEVREPFLEEVKRPNPFEPEKVMEFLDNVEHCLKDARPLCRQGKLVIRECRNGPRMAGLMTRIRSVLQADGKDPALTGIAEEILQEHRSLWLARSRACGLEEGIAGIYRAAAEAAGGGA